MDQEEGRHRRVPRYPFSATATVIPESGVSIGGNVTELSLYGCYLDSGAPLAPRTRVLVKIFAADGGYFEADATVIYSNPSLGMGLVFRQVRPDFLPLLRTWLLKAMQLSQAGGEIT
jgi:PilZ domain